MEVYIELFISFFKIGLFAFGGGYAVLSLIQFEILQHNWISEAEFTDIIAISQSTPGPIGINAATYVGYMATGSVWGSIVATTAIILPSFFIIITICKCMIIFKDNIYLKYILFGLRPIIIGLIASVAILLINKETFIDYTSYIIFGLTLIISITNKIRPIYLIILAGLCGLLIY